MAMGVRNSVRRASELWNRMHQHPMVQDLSILRMSTSSSQVAVKKLDGKVAIITGAAGGIGKVTAKLFAAHGAHVILADIAEEKGHQSVDEVGANAHFKYCDVKKEEDVAGTVDFAMEKFGKLDIMYNNAGFVTKLENFHTLDMNDYDHGTAVMVRGVVLGIKHAGRVMVPAKQGVILTTASIASEGVAGGFPLSYNINKSNLPGLTKIAAYHLGKHGIRVNAISPHAILTPLVFEWLRTIGGEPTYEEAEEKAIKLSSLSGKRCHEEDIANGALFLCSDDSSYISGQNLIVDGGWLGTKEYNFFDKTPEKI